MARFFIYPAFFFSFPGTSAFSVSGGSYRHIIAFRFINPGYFSTGRRRSAGCGFISFDFFGGRQGSCFTLDSVHDHLRDGTAFCTCFRFRIFIILQFCGIISQPEHAAARYVSVDAPRLGRSKASMVVPAVQGIVVRQFALQTKSSRPQAIGVRNIDAKYPIHPARFTRIGIKGIRACRMRQASTAISIQNEGFYIDRSGCGCKSGWIDLLIDERW